MVFYCFFTCPLYVCAVVGGPIFENIEYLHVTFLQSTILDISQLLQNNPVLTSQIMYQKYFLLSSSSSAYDFIKISEQNMIVLLLFLRMLSHIAGRLIKL